jgi:hypothetical protein
MISAPSITTMTSDTHAAGPVNQGEWLQTYAWRPLRRTAPIRSSRQSRILATARRCTFIRMRTSIFSFWKVRHASCAAMRGSTLRPVRPSRYRGTSRMPEATRRIRAPGDRDVLARRRRSYIAVDRTRRRHRRESPRNEIRYPRSGTAAARGISDRASPLLGRAHLIAGSTGRNGRKSLVC